MLQASADELKWQLFAGWHGAEPALHQPHASSSCSSDTAAAPGSSDLWLLGSMLLSAAFNIAPQQPQEASRPDNHPPCCPCPNCWRSLTQQQLVFSSWLGGMRLTAVCCGAEPVAWATDALTAAQQAVWGRPVRVKLASFAHARIFVRMMPCNPVPVALVCDTVHA